MKRIAWFAGFALLIAAAAAMLPVKEHLRALVFAGAALPEPDGPHAVGMAELDFAAGGVRLWYPAEVRQGARARSDPMELDRGSSFLLYRMFFRSTGVDLSGACFRPGRDWLLAPTRAPAFRDAPLARSPAKPPLVLYAPSWFARRDDNSFRAASLASHGYAVAAFDDVVHDAAGAGAAEGPDRSAALDFSSAGSYAATRPLADARAAREARKAAALLDALAAHPDWGARLDFGKVAFLGFSFGGAAAAEASRLDPRIKAVVNLDGWVLGEAARRGVSGPYLTLWSDFPTPFAMPGAREAEIRLMNEWIAAERRQMSEPGKYGFQIAGLGHLDFSDRLIWPAFGELRAPRAIDRLAMHRLIDAYILDFLGVHLLGRPPALVGLQPLPSSQVRSISSIAASQAGAASAPAKPD